MKLAELINSDLDEGTILDLTKRLLPKKLLHILNRLAHKDVYKKIIKLQHKMMNDGGMQPGLALVKSAEVYGIKPREIMAVMDKTRRYT